MRILPAIFQSRAGEYHLIDPLDASFVERYDIGAPDMSYYYDADRLSSAGTL